jgi:hypothetical protein
MQHPTSPNDRIAKGSSGDQSMITTTNQVVYVDVDGTLLSSGLDNAFKAKIGEVGIELAIQWYDTITTYDSLYINYELIAEIYVRHNNGEHFVIYTNRGSKQLEMTKANLGRYWHLFDDAIFTEGKKSKMFADGELWDNEARYSDKAVSFRLVEFA